MPDLILKPEEKLVVHRGMSDPLCPRSEPCRIIAKQLRDGFEKKLLGLIYAVECGGKIDLKLYDIVHLDVKTMGEPNALIEDTQSDFYLWWVHVVQCGAVDVGLIGRPNRRRLGPSFEPEFPILISTNVWKSALRILKTTDQPFMPQIREARFPRMAAAFDPTRSSIGA